MSRWSSPRKGAAIAVAVSLATHIVAAWGAGLWMTSAWQPKLPLSITVKLLGSEPAPDTGRSREPLRLKHAEEPLRSSPPSTPRLATVQKTLIAQKPLASRIAASPPRPDSNRTAVKDRLTAVEPDPGLEAAYKDSEPLGKTSSAEAKMPDGLDGALSPSPQGRTVVMVALETSEESDRALRLDAIRRRIQEALVYPPTARRFGWEGSALVRIVLGPDGTLSALTLESSSQITVLDREVLAAVRRAAPYPYVEGPIVVPVVFDLRAP